MELLIHFFRKVDPFVGMIVSFAIVAICCFWISKRYWRAWDPLSLVLILCAGVGFAFAALYALLTALG